MAFPYKKKNKERRKTKEGKFLPGKANLKVTKLNTKGFPDFGGWEAIMMPQSNCVSRRMALALGRSQGSDLQHYYDSRRYRPAAPGN